MSMAQSRSLALGAGLASLVWLLPGCSRDVATPPPAPPPPSSAAQKPTPGPLVRPQPQRAVLPAAAASWPAGLRRDVEQAIGLTDAGRSEAIRLILRIAKRGAVAASALDFLSNDERLAARLRAMAGVMLADLRRYDPAALQALALGTNSFAARHACTLLRNLGGAGSRQALLAVEKQRPALAAHIQAQLRLLVESSLAPRMLSLLNQLLADPSSEHKRLAATVLAVEFAGPAEKPLSELLRLIVADRESREQAAFALVEANKQQVLKLTAFAQRGQHPTLRLAAASELATMGQPGRAALRGLSTHPDDPLRSHIARLLARASKKTP